MHLQLLAFSSERQMFAAGDVVIKQGLRGGSAYLILSGRAAVYSGDDKIGVADPGAFLGEAGMIGDLPYSMTARAAEVLIAARIDRGLFMRLAAEYPAFGAAVLKVMRARLNGSMADLTEVQRQFVEAHTFKDL